jgi:AcrR family transcriptional regulator
VRSKPKRSYTKAARAESETETRNRIIDAVVALHEEIGPRRTSIKGIAERAGVQRLTVYRHFPTLTDLITACSSRWTEQQSPPPVVPAKGPLSREEARRLLASLYDYYRKAEPMLTRVVADAPFMPEVQSAMAPWGDYLDDLVSALNRTWRNKSSRRTTTLRHAVEFSTWRSLAALTRNDNAAVDLVLAWCDAA